MSKSTSQIRQDGHFHELQWNKSANKAPYENDVRLQHHNYKAVIWYLCFEPNFSSNSCGTSCHNFCKKASSLLFHNPHFHPQSKVGTLHLCWTDPALLQQYLLRQSAQVKKTIQQRDKLKWSHKEVENFLSESLLKSPTKGFWQ